uniref:Protein kinase domain-containing protein n=2 Tax=Paramoeba aestuarina TaxID=180227 RepID=A0A7S4L4E5_9EUKA|mmetsp:Transcript_31055/g.48408  ORF Transcript_31055/g.48408 Transcript_31055/m.48408 type:complete len:539 (+) Transcript_31055:66-1682(+)|eukprot:CAMPEP_0201522666 /NCGR_PEP_ID=MMETSP0161_2-20130828/18478_1 /ASSEMBLY_ACC=CAM_ASM_000251 /TAXON_ID=180227 /ORGANISM="Neoparamoeba aestuarina, Strain SoJaBio B1-5/56/2" /LENGTH=538 /DNA_ID=CAMNT_0047921579 /DNA_START=230 /DNA_END=1846 /DNA_ORIENTATION=-
MAFGLPEDFPYDIKRPLGHGSFASVYEGIDKKTKEQRAIKIVDLKKLQTKSHYAESEMKIMMRLQASKHPSVVGMHKAFKVNEESMALVLEFCDQGDLSSYVDQQEGKRLPEEKAKKLMQDLALGLSFLRSKNIIHRDLKPQNLLLKSCPSGLALKLADFGFAKELEDFSNEVIPSLVGSPMYLAPELWNREGYTTQSDLWSVGVILYEVIFGHYLYFAKSIPALVQLVKTKDVEFPPDLIDSVSPECLDLIRGLLRKDPEERLSWDKYLGHPWLDLETRKMVDSFEDLESNSEDEEPLIEHSNIDPSRSLEQKPSQSESGDFESPESQESKEPPSKFVDKPMESPHLSVLDPAVSIAPSSEGEKAKEEGEGREEDVLQIVKALHQLAKLVETGEPERALSLHMEILSILKGEEMKSVLVKKTDLERAKAQSLFEKSMKAADTLTTALPKDTKIPTSFNVIYALAVEMNQKAEIDELFSAYSMASEEYFLAALLIKHLLFGNNVGKEKGEEERGVLEGKRERYERSGKSAVGKAKKKE